MTIKVSKPAINIREELADLKQDTGLKGQELMRADTVAEVRTAISAGRKNLIINGGFDVWQRGTTATTSGTGYGRYDSVDRWGSYYNGTVISKQSATIEGSIVNTYKLVYSATNIFTYTKIENGSHLVSGKPVTLSFYAKSASSSRLRVRGRFYDSGAETNSSVHDIEVATTNLLTTEWVKYSYTYTPVDASVNMTRDYMIILDNGSSGTAGDDLEFAQVQLELGSVATEFEHRSYGEELALCQRYYQAIANGELWGSTNTTSRMRINARLSPDMRNTPTITRVSGTTVSFQGSGVGKTSTDTSSAQAATSSPRALGFDLGGFTSLGDRAYAGGNSAAVVFTADAEL
jgi:hypothetical protein